MESSIEVVLWEKLGTGDGQGGGLGHAPASRKEHRPINEDTSGEENIPAGGKLSATKAKNKGR